jgi:uncharacterized protein (TIGR02646 family)
MAKAQVPRRPTYRQPGPRLARTVQFSQGQMTFLNSIKPWTKKQWSSVFGTPIEHNARNDIKNEIKSQLEVIQDNYCAFCGMDLALAPDVHREHLAPQYKHPSYIFEPENLVLACYYCNMHKKKKLTVTTNTGLYNTETFKILHPHRDDYNLYLSCNFNNNELVFTILNPLGGKTKATIDCVGLAEPHLVTQRGALILKEELSRIPPLNFLVNQTIKITRKRK